MGTEWPWARGCRQAEAGYPGRSEDGDLDGKPSGEPGGSRGLSSRGSRWGGCGGVAGQGAGKSTVGGTCSRGGGAGAGPEGDGRSLLQPGPGSLCCHEAGPPALRDWAGSAEAEGAGRPSPCTGTPRGVGRGCGQKMACRTRWIPRHPQAVLGSQCSRGPAWDPRVRGWAEVGGCPSFLRRAGGTRGGSRARGGPPTCLGRCRAPNRSFPPRREQKWSSLSSAR